MKFIDQASFFNNYSFIGSGQLVHTPPLAIKLFGQDMQNLWFAVGTDPSGHNLQEPSKSIISSGLQGKHIVLSPFGNEPSAQGSQSPVVLTI